MHQWGDENVDWKGIDECCDILYKYCYKYGRLGGQIKEKYGTVRFYAKFGWLSLHSLIYPGWAFSQFPNWLYKLDNRVIGPVLRFFFERPFFWWQKQVYNYAYQQCLKKYPHLKEEILSAADYPEFIAGAEEYTRSED